MTTTSNTVSDDEPPDNEPPDSAVLLARSKQKKFRFEKLVGKLLRKRKANTNSSSVSGNASISWDDEPKSRFEELLESPAQQNVAAVQNPGKNAPSYARLELYRAGISSASSSYYYRRSSTSNGYTATETFSDISNRVVLLKQDLNDRYDYEGDEDITVCWDWVFQDASDSKYEMDLTEISKATRWLRLFKYS